jgi:hypothetical protein
MRMTAIQRTVVTLGCRGFVQLSLPIKGCDERRFYAVLQIDAIRTPLDAVRAAIVAEQRAEQ